MTDILTKTRWQDYSPQEAKTLDLSVRLDISAPLNENGHRCPWPWEPQQLSGSPLGMYHCRYCGAMVMAGMDHIDYSGIDEGWPESLNDVDDIPDFGGPNV